VDVAEAFGENLKRLRAERDESQEALSAKSDLHRTVISQIEGGKSEAKASTILKLSGALGVDPGELFAGMRWRPSRTTPGRYELPD
jgi:transcriptional regulator with XRE-family HTH domain